MAALAAYRAAEWELAATAFEALKHQEDDLLYNVYLDRIDNFRRSPPPQGWDGVFDHLSK